MQKMTRADQRRGRKRLMNATTGTKHDLLSEDQLNAFRLSAGTLEVLRQCAERFGIDQQELRVLDWGCGRGRTVIRLLELGIDAYGVDVDPGPIRNGSSLLRDRGHDPKKRLICIEQDCRTPFPDAFFHVVLSDQVLEHVRELDRLATEMARIIKNKGEGLHTFPAKWRVVEPHLFIPFVHWLPKNRLRRWYLRLMINRVPLWKGLEEKALKDRVQIYYDYSVRKTFYRPLRQIGQAFENAGVSVRLSLGAPMFRQLRIFNKLIPQRMHKWWQNNFRGVIVATVAREP